MQKRVTFYALFFTIFVALGSVHAATKKSSSATEKDVSRFAALREKYKGLFVTQPIASPPLYKFEKSGVRPSYILGTIHIGISARELPPALIDRLTRSREVYFEIAEADIEDLQKEAADPIQYAVETLRQHRADYPKRPRPPLTKTEIEALVALGVPKPIAELLHAKLLSYEVLEFLMPIYNFSSPISLDAELMLLCAKNGVKLLSLENEDLREQADEIEGLEAKAVTLREALVEPDRNEALWEGVAGMLTEYRSGNPTIFETPDPADEPEEKAAMRLRNETWLKNLGSKLDQGDLFLVAGMGHLPGEEGLIHMLKALGFTVTFVSDMAREAPNSNRP